MCGCSCSNKSTSSAQRRLGILSDLRYPIDLSSLLYLSFSFLFSHFFLPFPTLSLLLFTRSRFFSPSLPDTTLQTSLPSSLSTLAYVSSGFCYVSFPPHLTNGPLNSQLISLLQMVEQQQLQRPTFFEGSNPSMQHNMLSQFQDNWVINQMATPQLHAASQQNWPTPAMLAGPQPTQAGQLELVMAQHQPSHGNQANGLVPSRLNSSQPVQQGFPQGMIGGTPNSGQLSQGKPLCCCRIRRFLTCDCSQPCRCCSNVR